MTEADARTADYVNVLKALKERTFVPKRPPFTPSMN